MRRIFTLFFVFITCIGRPTKSFAQINHLDSLVLVDLYNRTNGAGWLNNSGWLTSPVSNWNGITLTGNRVTSIDLNTNNLTGTIPDSLGLLDALNSLVLGTNRLTGSIPTSLGNLTNLGANFGSLVLGSNQLSGTIPTSLGNLVNLSNVLDLSSNQLTGSIPTSLGNLTSLSNLYLYNNLLSGAIPASLGNLANVLGFQLNNNKLSGAIPDALSMLVSVNYIDLSSNQLTDTIPASFGSLFNLNILYLYNNQLTGSIPASLGTLSNLQYLNLSANQLSGSIPASIDNLSNLNGLSLNFNQLTGSIPASLGKSNIFFMDLSHNLLSGTVPLSFTNLTSSSTDINNNKLTFDGLEQVAPALNAGTLVDSPQAILQLHLAGSKLSVYAGGTLANDTFHWYKNGVLDTTIIGDSTFTPTPFGNYSVAISNKIVTPINGLVLYSDTLPAGMILPVNFLNFTGILANNDALLQWQTSAEINTAYFNVQRSISGSGSNFTNIGKVTAAGNSSGTGNYHYTDDLSSLIGQITSVFYRLQEVDENGNSTYSNIVNLQLNTPVSTFTIYPNPVKDVLNISLGSNSGNALITVFDINGHRLLKQPQTVVTNSNISINASNFATGIYFIQISINGSTLQQKFVKE
jgi:Leucine-rich repeat (LRR) protein